MQRTTTILALLIAFAVASAAANVQNAEIGGTWTITVPATPRGTLEFTAVLAVEGEKITGTMEGLPGKFDVTGTLKGEAVVFGGVMAQEPPVPIEFEGKLAEGTMSGTVDLGGMFQGEWSAKRTAD